MRRCYWKNKMDTISNTSSTHLPGDLLPLGSKGSFKTKKKRTIKKKVVGKGRPKSKAIKGAIVSPRPKRRAVTSKEKKQKSGMKKKSR